MFSGRNLITPEADALDMDELDGLGLNHILDRISRTPNRHDVALDGMGWSMRGGGSSGKTGLVNNNLE